MSETFLDDQAKKTLADDLRAIASDYPELARIAHRETSPPGGRAARNPAGYDSRPPVNIAALSSTHELHAVLGGWVSCLRDDALVEVPARTDTTSLAIHLQRHVDQIACQVWATDCADEVSDWAKVVAGHVTANATWRGRTGPAPAELGAAAQDILLNEADTIALHESLTKTRISGSTLRTWRSEGKLPAIRISGAAMYRYADVRQALMDSPSAEGRHAKM